MSREPKEDLRLAHTAVWESLVCERMLLERGVRKR